MQNILRVCILVLAFLVTGQALACSCGSRSWDWKKFYLRSEMVFLGTVTEVAKLKSPKGKALRVATFKIEKAYKGVTGDTVKLTTESHMCGSHFEIGQKYLQFAFKDPSKNNVCNGSRVAEAKSAKKILKSLNAGKSSGESP